MRKFVLLSVSFVFLMLQSFTSQAQIRIAPRIGMSSSLLSYKGPSLDNYVEDFRRGLVIGVQGDIPFYEKFSLRPGIFYTSRGDRSYYSYSGSGSFRFDESKTIINYLEIPVLVNRAFPIGKKSKSWIIDVNAGPYMAFALSGKSKTDDNTTDLEFGNDQEQDDLRGSDFGFSIGTGFEHRQFSLGINYNHGLSNLVPGGDSENKVRNRALTLTVGYFFPVTQKKSTK